MCGPGFFSLLERSKDHVEVLDVCAVHEHPYSEGEPVYFSDVIIHTSNSSVCICFYPLAVLIGFFYSTGKSTENSRLFADANGLVQCLFTRLEELG